MDDIKRRRIAGQVKRFCGRFAQGAHSALERMIPQQSLLQWIEEEAGHHSERVYGPMQTLALFIAQVLGADQSCQDAVARGLSQRVALGQSPCGLNNGPYCKALARPGSQTHRRHDGFHARHLGEPIRVSPGNIAQADH